MSAPVSLSDGFGSLSFDLGSFGAQTEVDDTTAGADAAYDSLNFSIDIPPLSAPVSLGDNFGDFNFDLDYGALTASAGSENDEEIDAAAPLNFVDPQINDDGEAPCPDQDPWAGFF